MTGEQLAKYNAERKAHLKVKMAEISKRVEEREKTADLQAYLLRKRAEKNAWTELNREKVRGLSVLKSEREGDHSPQTIARPRLGRLSL